MNDEHEIRIRHIQSLIRPRLRCRWLVLGFLLAVSVAVPAVAGITLVEEGRRIYEEGVLPDGEPLRAIRPEGFIMEGKYAACVVCHRRSGMGSVEGNADNTVLVPPVTGAVLFAPSRYATIPIDPSHHFLPNAAWERVLTRTAYDAESLARALRVGLDPDKRQLVSPMPRFDLDDTAMAALTAYLSQLGSDPEPGVEADVLHLATIIAGDADPDADAVLKVLQEWSRFARGSGVPWHLHEWRLAGEPSTWQQQLSAYYIQRPVFAVLSGTGRSEWEPVQRFCEDQQLPCVLPSLDIIPETANDWYSVYFSPGVELEAKILAQYLSEQFADTETKAEIVQVYSDNSGRRAAETLAALMDGGRFSISQRRYRMISPGSALKKLSADTIVILWLRPDEITQLVTLFPQIPTDANVYLSAMLTSPEQIQLPKSWKQQASYVSLFDDLGLQGEIARIRLEEWLERAGQAGSANRRLQADAYAASYLFNAALGEIRKQEIRRPAVNLNREHVIETLEPLINKYNDSTELIDTESHIAWYGRMSLGPRQRIAVRGGAILGYQSVDSNKLRAVSKHIVP